MWLTSSSIGRKFLMALTGIALVLFVTFHCLMNTVAIMWPAAYNQICMFLGANWYAVAASVGLAVLLIIHIVYAFWLTIQNRAARGDDRYEVTSRPPQVEWSSKNMLVLGIVILAFLVVHMIQFWYKMQWQDLIHDHAYVDGVPAPGEFGTLFLQQAFSQVYTPIVYIIAFIALWFHLTHGFWSMFHSIGWDNNLWINRLKCIGNWWVTIVVALFIAQAIVFTVKAHNQDFLKDPKLQEQYAEYWGNQAQNAVDDLFATMANIQQDQNLDSMAQQAQVDTAIADFMARYEEISNIMQKQCPECLYVPAMAQANEIYGQIVRQQRQQEYIQQMQMQQAQQATDATEEIVLN